MARLQISIRSTDSMTLPLLVSAVISLLVILYTNFNQSHRRQKCQIKMESSSGVSLPQDLSLPLFVYGSLKPGMPAFESISKLVIDDPESVQVVGILNLRDGLPLLFLYGSKKIKGYCSKVWSKKSGYKHVCAFELPPVSLNNVWDYQRIKRGNLGKFRTLWDLLGTIPARAGEP